MFQPTMEQKRILAECLKRRGVSLLEATLIGLEVWEPEDTLEMLEYIKTHPTANPAELLEVSSKICSRRESKSSLIDEEDEDEEKPSRAFRDCIESMLQEEKRHSLLGTKDSNSENE